MNTLKEERNCWHAFQSKNSVPLLRCLNNPILVLWQVGVDVGNIRIRTVSNIVVSHTGKGHNAHRYPPAHEGATRVALRGELEDLFISVYSSQLWHVYSARTDFTWQKPLPSTVKPPAHMTVSGSCLCHICLHLSRFRKRTSTFWSWGTGQGHCRAIPHPATWHMSRSSILTWVLGTAIVSTLRFSSFTFPDSCRHTQITWWFCWC